MIANGRPSLDPPAIDGEFDEVFDYLRKLGRPGLDPSERPFSTVEIGDECASPAEDELDAQALAEAFGATGDGSRAIDLEARRVDAGGDGRRFVVRSLQEVAELAATEHAWLVDGLVRPSGLTLLGGASRAGKSRLAASMGACVSVGEPWCGRATRQGGVLWLPLDRGIGDGYHAIASACAAVKGATIRLLDGRRPGERWRADKREHVDELADILDEEGARLVVVDCLRAMHRGDENDSGMRNTMEALQRLADKRAVLPLHHTGRSGELRGSTDIEAACQSVLKIARSKEKVKLEAQHHLAEAAMLRLWDHQLAPWRGPRDPGMHRFELDAEGPSGLATGATAEQLKAAILEYVDDHPGATTREICADVTGKRDRVRGELATLVTEGMIVAREDGKATRHYLGGAE